MVVQVEFLYFLQLLRLAVVTVVVRLNLAELAAVVEVVVVEQPQQAAQATHLQSLLRKAIPVAVEEQAAMALVVVAVVQVLPVVMLAAPLPEQEAMVPILQLLVHQQE